MSIPIELKENYGKIPENPKQEIKRPRYSLWFQYLRNVDEFFRNQKTDVSGYYRFCPDSAKDLSSACVVPIKDGKKITGWFISDLKDEKGNPLWAPCTNLILLQGKDGNKGQVFFTEYGQSFSEDEISDKYLEDSYAKSLTKSMLSLELPSKTGSYSLSEHRELFSFFSRRLAELGEDQKLKELQRLLAYCAEPALRKGAVEKVREILPGLISSYDKLAEKSNDDRLRLLLLNAIDQRTRAILDEKLNDYPTRGYVPGREDAVLSLDLIGAIDCSIEEIAGIRAELKSNKDKTLSKKGKLLLKAIDLYENCLTAIYAKDANQPLQTEDLICFEIFAHKMKLAAKDYLNTKEKYQKNKITVDDQYGLPSDPAFDEAPWDSFEKIAFLYPDIYSLHLLEANKLGKDDLMYHWALQHAEEMGVPVGNYRKLDKKVYARLSEVAKLDEPSGELKKLNRKGLLKETEKEGIYVTRRGSEENITLTIPGGQNEGCCLPKNKVLLEMAHEAGWQTGRTKRLLDAIERKKGDVEKYSKDVKKYSVEYLISKLKLKSTDGYDKKDVKTSLRKLKNRKISIDDLQGLDRPSTAKVILAAKKCGIRVNANCQSRLAKILEQPHRPFFCCSFGRR